MSVSPAIMTTSLSWEPSYKLLIWVVFMFFLFFFMLEYLNAICVMQPLKKGTLAVQIHLCLKVKSVYFYNSGCFSEPQIICHLFIM